MPTRRGDRIARAMADQQSRRLATIPAAKLFRATVTTVTAAAASDGNALVTVTYRGTETPVADYPDSYSPTVNDRVLCALVDGQPSILHHGIGYP